MHDENFQVPYGEGGEDLMLTKEEANSFVARVAYRQGYEDGARESAELGESLVKQTELSTRAHSTRQAAEIVGIFVAIPGGALIWALGGEVAGLVTLVAAMAASFLLLHRSSRLRQAAKSQILR